MKNIKLNFDEPFNITITPRDGCEIECKNLLLQEVTVAIPDDILTGNLELPTGEYFGSQEITLLVDKLTKEQVKEILKKLKKKR